MFFSLDLANLVLFCAQELGVAMGLGAQTVMMTAYFQAMRDGLIDAKEAQFLRATRRVSFVALAAIVISGLLITALHLSIGDAVIIFSPAYLFKWLLIVVVIALTAFAGSLPKNIFEMLISANWYALFFVHVLAPVTTWISLLEWWAVWLVGFGLCWYAAPFFAHRHTGTATSIPGMPAHVAEKQAAVKPKEPESPKPAVQEQKIKLEERPVIELPKELQTPMMPIASAAPIKPIPQQTLAIKPTDVPMPANKTTDTPFLPKVPPLQPIPTPALDAAAVQPKAPDAQSESQQPPVPQDSLAINVMPKSPDQVKQH